MDFFKKLKKQKNTPNEILSEREKIKKDIKKTLKKLGLNDKEIKETLEIVDKAQNKIETLKKQLIGTNINQDPTEIQEKIMVQIQQISNQMQIDLKKKVQEILNKI
ncbi:MAG: hypothetical protein V2B14_06520 [bacterium]